MKMMGRLPLIAVLLATSAPAAVVEAQAAAGRLVIIGGGLSSRNAEVYRAILDGRDGDGPICVIPTASADPAAAIESGVAALDSHGGAGTAVGVMISVDMPEGARDQALVDNMRGCSGFYFSGGVQSRILDVLRPDGTSTPAYEVLLERFREGAVIAGSSAGAAIMSDPMIAGGSSAGAVTHGVSSADGDGVIITPGLGFVRGMLMDQHFLARGRIGRLIVAVLELEDVDLGFGVDENTAIVIEGTAAWPVGASGVVVLDQRDAAAAGTLRMHLISAGDRYDIATRTVVPDARKTPLGRAPRPLGTPPDVFARWQFLHLLETFGRSGAARIRVPGAGGAIVELTRTADAAVLGRPGTGVQGAAAGLTFTGLTVRLTRQ